MNMNLSPGRQTPPRPRRRAPGPGLLAAEGGPLRTVGRKPKDTGWGLSFLGTQPALPLAREKELPWSPHSQGHQCEPASTADGQHRATGVGELCPPSKCRG